ncbi:unnamed protein product (macronuclear) [Paramecium tetraurelia]|uniref:HMG box domain-containing protein n=1 Tax=Paramecium tetraurelia TaxID=5888 RepID=A0D3H5_PARTE|nr:uncharacterized protein GSPATT00013080001 [Paramecium tetraurelia]CAK77592.1 unnamed protein product [Paramecium tetraurelia]|eukprot:XP_001444989.1 hypothetical protein (macronuclear) [Paramecium tetraurelia strain d4-2]
MDYKIHQYSPEELYENKARLFEQLMTEWNNMTATDQEKFSLKVRFTNGGEKSKYRKDESSSETMYETADEKPTKVIQPIIEEKSESKEKSEEKKSQEVIKEEQNNKHVASNRELKQELVISYEVISEKESNSQQPLKSQTSINQQIIQEKQIDENEENKSQEDSRENKQNQENLTQENQVDQKPGLKRGRRISKGQRPSQKGNNDTKKQKGGQISKRALSISKQKQLDSQQSEKQFSVNDTLTLKQLKDQIKNLFKQIE